MEGFSSAEEEESNESNEDRSDIGGIDAQDGQQLVDDELTDEMDEFVESPTLSLPFIDTYTYFPYVCQVSLHKHGQFFVRLRTLFTSVFCTNTEVRHLVTFFYLVLTYYLVCL